MSEEERTLRLVVSASSLGKCEHCSTLILIHNMPGGMPNRQWQCPTCGGVLSLVSFGYELKEIKGEPKLTKTKWVGENGIWEEAPPEKDFELPGVVLIVKG